MTLPLFLGFYRLLCYFAPYRSAGRRLVPSRSGNAGSWHSSDQYAAGLELELFTLFSRLFDIPWANKNWYVHVFSEIHVQKQKKTIQQLVGWLVVWIVCSVCCVFPIFTYFTWDQVFRMTLTRFGLKVPIRIWLGRVIPVTKIHEDHKFGPAQFALALQAGLATLGDRVPAEEHRHAEGNQFAFGCLGLQCSRRLRAKKCTNWI